MYDKMYVLHMDTGHFGRIALFILSAMASLKRLELGKLRVDLHAYCQCWSGAGCQLGWW